MREINTKNGVDLASRSHTELPVPAELTVKPSGIRLGVFANVLIPVEVEMGPYEGKVVDEEHMANVPSTSYAWEVIIATNPLTHEGLWDNLSSLSHCITVLNTLLGGPHL